MKSQVPLELVGGIYEAALEPDLWGGVLRQIETYLGATSSVLFLQDLQARQASFSVSHGLDVGLLPAYYAHYVQKDPNFVYRLDKPEGTITASHQIQSDSEFMESEYYRDFLRQTGVFYTAGALISREPSRIANFGVHRPREGGPFSAVELQRMEGLFPHLRRSFQIGRQLAAGEVERQAMLAMLEQLPTGVVLLDEQRRVVFLNRRAQAIVTSGDCLAIALQALQTVPGGLQPTLERLIGEAVETGAGRAAHTGGAMTVPGRSGHNSYQVLVTPLRTTRVRVDVGRERICAALFVQLRDAQPTLSADVLRDLFGFTPAEARVAVALAHGRKPGEIAAEFETSRYTVRAQLSAIYEKLGVHRQAEVVERVLRSPAVLGDGSGPPPSDD